MPKVGVSLLHSAWGLSWANLNSLVLESSEGVLIHFSGAWAGMSQRLGSAGMVDYDAIMWTSSQHGDLRAVRLLTLLLRAPRVGPLVTGRSLKDFPGGTSGKEAACQCKGLKRHRFDIWVRKIPWSRKWQPTPGSWLENPMGRGTQWATVHGVAESNTTEQLSTHREASWSLMRKSHSIILLSRGQRWWAHLHWLPFSMKQVSQALRQAHFAVFFSHHTCSWDLMLPLCLDVDYYLLQLIWCSSWTAQTIQCLRNFLSTREPSPQRCCHLGSSLHSRMHSFSSMSISVATHLSCLVCVCVCVCVCSSFQPITSFSFLPLSF